MLSEKQPLVLYVLWHENFTNGYEYAKKIFKIYNRDVNDLNKMGIGIPVYFPQENKNFNNKLEINFDISEKVAIILLVDSFMVVDSDWHEYLAQILEKCDKYSNYIIYPVAINKSSLKLPIEKIEKKNYIRMYEKDSNDEKFNFMMLFLTHELCRLLYDLERVSYATTNTAPPVKLFLSHAKKDGLEITNKIREYIELDTPLNDFFDAKDISVGQDFEQEIEKGLENSMLLIIHTDKYSSREFCRKEVILSKKKLIPILILNCFDEIEYRSFPYMGNLKTLHLKSKEDVNVEKIVRVSLLEILRYKYQKKYIDYALRIFNVTEKKKVLCYPPELFSISQNLNLKEKLVIYPDPPLSEDELSIINTFNSEIKCITPVLLSTIRNSDKTNKGNINIGISISETNEENLNGLETIHMQDAMNEIARYLIISGYKLSYGGDLRYNDKFNFVENLINLIDNYNNSNYGDTTRLTNYVANYLKDKIDVNAKADLIDKAEFKIVNNMVCEEYNDELHKKYMHSLDLSKMREEMNRNIQVRLVMGGKRKGYQGKYPGILEEVMLAMESKKPIYLIGAYGGITKDIIFCLEGKEQESISYEYQAKYNEYYNFYKYYNEKSSEKINYNKICQYLKDKGVKSLNNGLSEEENKVLFYSSNILLIISIILKGLRNIN